MPDNERITAAQASAMIAADIRAEIDKEQAAILPKIYALIREAVAERKTELNVREVREMLPKADFSTVRKVLIDDDGYSFDGEHLSWKV